MAARRRLLPPRHLLVLLVSITLALATALVWLGSRLVRQDRILEGQRVRERLETAATSVAAVLERRLAGIEAELTRIAALPGSAGSTALAAWGYTLAAGAVAVELGPERTHAYPPGRLLYYPGPAPTGATPAGFAAGERLEFQARDLAGAARTYGAIAERSRGSERAGALLRLGRTLRKAGRPTEALAAYQRLGRLDSVAVDGIPAGLAGRYAALELLESLRRPEAARAEADSLLGDLETGRWRLSRSAFEYHAAEVRRRLQNREPAGSDSRTLSRALDSLWTEWGTGGSGGPRRRALTIDGKPVVAAWRSEPGSRRRLAWLATSTHMRSALLPELDPLLRGEGLQLALNDSSGTRILADSAAAEPELTRSLAELGLPWSVELGRLDRSGADAGINDRRRILFAGLLVASLLGLLGTYAVARSVARELRVARLQTDFVAAVSHEFRTPLTSLRQLSEMLVGDRVTTEERRRTYYEVLRRESVRLQRLVEGLLDFGRMEAGAREYRLEPVNATELVSGVVSEFREEPGCADYTIVLEASGPTCAVRADREALGRALWNLLDNAVKYSPDAREVAVAIARENGQVAISVRDRGPGIPEAEQQAVFEKFVRGSAAVQSGARGTGLGLAMVRAILAAHGGQVQVSSSPGHGSTFTMVLPATGPE